MLNVSLSQSVSADVISELQKLLTSHRLLLFRNQGKISGARQVEISQWWGPLQSTFYKHEASPHPDVFRVSNDEIEGCTQVGRSGWHIDGSFMDSPFVIQTMHFHSVCSGGDTMFSPLKELVQSLPGDTLSYWQRLFFESRSARSGGAVHPLVARHPFSGDPTMVFHCGPGQAFPWWGWRLCSRAGTHRFCVSIFVRRPAGV